MRWFSRSAAPATPLAPLPYPDDTPEGLAARWIRWVAGAGVTQDPIEDPNGMNAGLRQPADVCFLAGTYGGRRQVVRRVALPAGVPLFFPVVNAWSQDAVMPVLARAHGAATLDGVALPASEIGTPIPFEVRTATRRNPIAQTRRSVSIRVWGLWSRTAALPPGAHTVAFTGGDGAELAVDVRYEVDVQAARS